MSVSLALHESGYVCDGKRHVGDRLVSPLVEFVTRGEWYCGVCLARAIDAEVEAEDDTTCDSCTDVIPFGAQTYCGDCVECSECTNKATKCEEHSSTQCSNCGETITTAFCDASCALSYGYEGGHSCEASCSVCGDTAYYCSPDCGMQDGEKLHCSECGKERNATAECPACRGKRGHFAEAEPATGSPQQVKAASEVATADDGSVVIDGMTIRF